MRDKGCHFEKILEFLTKFSDKSEPVVSILLVAHTTVKLESDFVAKFYTDIIRT